MLIEQFPLQKEIVEMFKDRPVALSFLGKCIQYYHAIDDVVDEGNQHIQVTTRLAFEVFNHAYWIQWRQSLTIVERLIHNAFYDSTVWESSTEEWKKRDAKVLNQRGYDMLFAVILIEFGEDTLDKFSNKFREFSHVNQGHDKI